MLYANFPGIMGSNAGMYNTVTGNILFCPNRQNYLKPMTNPANNEPVAISTPK